jgi:hypothetical protein
LHGSTLVACLLPLPHGSQSIHLHRGHREARIYERRGVSYSRQHKGILRKMVGSLDAFMTHFPDGTRSGNVPGTEDVSSKVEAELLTDTEGPDSELHLLQAQQLSFSFTLVLFASPRLIPQVIHQWSAYMRSYSSSHTSAFHRTFSSTFSPCLPSFLRSTDPPLSP